MIVIDPYTKSIYEAEISEDAFGDFIKAASLEMQEYSRDNKSWPHPRWDTINGIKYQIVFSQPIVKMIPRFLYLGRTIAGLAFLEKSETVMLTSVQSLVKFLDKERNW